MGLFAFCWMDKNGKYPTFDKYAGLLFFDLAKKNFGYQHDIEKSEQETINMPLYVEL